MKRHFARADRESRSWRLLWLSATVAVSLVLSLSGPFVTSSSAADSSPASTCMADRTLDSVKIGKYFATILAQAQKDWRKDANISSVRFDARLDKNFDSLCKLTINSSWMIVLYSLSTKTEQVLYANNPDNPLATAPILKYNVKRVKSNSTTFSVMSVADMKKDGGWVFDVFSRPETAVQERRGPANLFLKWKMSLSDIVQKYLDITRTEKITEYGFNIYIGKRSLKTGSPYAYIYWQNGAKKQSYYVEPITLKTYLVKY